MSRISTSIDDIYLTVAKDLLKATPINGMERNDIRDGNTRELLNVKLVLKDINNNIVSIRGISPSYLMGELLWYFSGNNKLEFISKFGSAWENLSDDGVTCNSAYGFLMKYAHGFNQIEKVIEILKRDPNSRRAKINLNTPNEHVIETRDEPCTMCLHFMIRNNNLDCTAVMRSNDIWFGFPYDVAFFTELQKYIAMRLGVEHGWYTHFAVSLHLYDRDVDKIAEIVENPISKPITWDRKKFYKNYNFLADITGVATRHCSADFVKRSTLDRAKELIDYKYD